MFSLCLLLIITSSAYNHARCVVLRAADPNVRSSPSSNEVTPLHVAAECGNLACLQLLVLSGGEVTAKDSLMRTPSSCASVSGQRLCCSYLSEVLGTCVYVHAISYLYTSHMTLL